MKKRLGFKDSIAFKAACKMPAGLKHQPTETFSYADSEVAKWLLSQPEIAAYLFHKCQTSDAIVFVPKTKTWKGALYAK